MSNFKVICKVADNRDWCHDNGAKVVKVKRFFGLISESRVVNSKKYVPGPSKDEICIVNDCYNNEEGETYYILAGYPYGGYNSKYFVRLDEFTETAKEIAQKAEIKSN